MANTTDIYNLDLEDIDFKESSSITLNPCKQYDDIILNLNLFQDGEPIDLSQFTVDLRVLKNDNSFVIQDETKGITKTNNTLKIECIKSVTNVAGKAKCEIRLVNSNSKQKTSFNFVLPIKPSVINDNSIDTSSVVTIVETLNTNIDSARQWHTTLTNDIEIAVPLQASLHKDIQDANTFRIQFNKDVAEGKELYPKLHSDIAEGKELDNTLNTSMNNAKESINLIRSSGNPHFDILASDWITNTDTSSTLGYMKDITHNLETQYIVINAFDITTGMEIFPNVRRIDNNTLRFFNDNNADGIKVVLSARYYDGGSDIGDEVKGARKTFETIGKRFDDIDSHLEDIAINIETCKLLVETDWTGAIRRAIEKCPKGGVVLIPHNTSGYIVKSDSLKYLFKLDKPITILGHGITSSLVLDGVPSDTDIFYISPKDSSNTEGYFIDGVTIIGKDGGIYGRHAINVDTTLDYQKVSRSAIRNCFIYPTNGYSIYQNNPTNSDGFFCSNIEYNLLYSGIHFNRCGDSVNVYKNTIAGYNGLDLSMVDGSNTFVFENNNFTARKGIIVRSGHNIKIKYNNIELGYSDSDYTNGAIVDLDGEGISYSWGLLACEFKGNNITFRHSTTPISALRINKARSVLIEGNHLTNNGGNIIDITSKAIRTIVGNNVFSASNPLEKINDLSTTTIYENLYLSSVEFYSRYKNKIVDKCSEYDIISPNIVRSTDDLYGYEKYLWKVENTSKVKYQTKSQVKNTDGTLGAERIIEEIHDGVKAFPNGIRLKSPNGFYWEVTINDDGTVKTTRIN